MKRYAITQKSGQGTLEYILLTSLVVGVILTIFNGPLRKFLASYKSRQTQYTNVLSQRDVGIPLAWFGGNYPDPGGGANAGGVNAGGETAGDTNVDPPGATDGPNSQNPPAGGEGDGGDIAGPTRGGAGAGAGSGNPPNNSLLAPGSSGTANNNRSGRNARGADGEEEGAEDTATGGGATGVTTGGSGQRADGSLSQDDPESETEEERETARKTGEGGEVLSRDAQTIEANQRRIRDGSCGDLDLKVILQIAFVIGLFFLLASMLFQKRGGKD